MSAIRSNPTAFTVNTISPLVDMLRSKEVIDPRQTCAAVMYLTLCLSIIVMDVEFLHPLKLACPPLPPKI